MKINLRKALQRKSTLISEINKHKSTIQKFNVQKVGLEEKFVNLDEELRMFRVKTEELIRLKTLITNKNVDIYEKLTRVEEIKTLISFYETLSVKDTVEKEYDRKLESYVEVTFKSFINRQDITGLTDLLKKELGELIDEIDVFNTTTHIYVTDPELKNKKSKTALQ
jgi:hypothetical protein